MTYEIAARSPRESQHETSELMMPQHANALGHVFGGVILSMMDTAAAVKEQKKTGLKVGIVGYCMGGSLAWLAATRVDGLSAAVSY